ncbi:MAG: M55 family metallopeptidase [Planctomycetota bacterium]|nr:M55 family metallopeptidase [Planctomycetota bacterium]
MKIYMLWDMEGVSGLFTREQVWFWEPGVRQEAAEEGQRLLIADVNSAVAAALEAGADSVIVCDTHHGGENIRVVDLLADARVTYHVRSTVRYGLGRRFLPGFDRSVDGLMLLGHHAKAGAPDAFLPHTQGPAWLDVWINGQSVGEVGLEACYAGHWDVPLILAQGDEAMAREVAEQFPETVTVAVKRALTPDLCTGPSPEAARRLTAERVALAVERARAGAFPPFKPALPLTVRIRLETAVLAEKGRAAARREARGRTDRRRHGRAALRRAQVDDGRRGRLGGGPQAAGRRQAELKKTFREEPRSGRRHGSRIEATLGKEPCDAMQETVLVPAGAVRLLRAGR